MWRVFVVFQWCVCKCTGSHAIMCWCPLWWVSSSLHSSFIKTVLILVLFFNNFLRITFCSFNHLINVPFLKQVLWICWVLLLVRMKMFLFLWGYIGYIGYIYTYYFFLILCTGLVMVSLSGYLIEVTLSWATVFTLIILVNAMGLGIFIIFGDARRVDLEITAGPLWFDPDLLLQIPAWDWFVRLDSTFESSSLVCH